ncbi:MAG: D-alanyl-D-alanine carboxypeptidase [Deltaproteobacteria bacterium]|nr:D-alanyl-D-alanine carboxypeptidase [Deltaproteobacteria bacterium]
MLFLGGLLALQPQILFAGPLDPLHSLIGKTDAVLVADPEGRILFSENAQKKLVPASTLKILTALVALHYLGPNYRFPTEFYLDKDSNLKIKGYGDPLLISEIMKTISKSLKQKVKTVNDIIIDATYFEDPLTIPGVSASSEPYDAPNGALCVNFNTVHFRRTENGTYVSAEPQTPLLPVVLQRIETSGINEGRIVLSKEKHENVLYAGYLFQYFLNREGIRSSGSVRTGKVKKDSDRLIYTYTSQFSLTQVISKLLEHSNNFTANQLLITSGVKAYGPPGNLEKGVRAAKDYTKHALKRDDIRVVEGSGISRSNRISAETLHAALDAFKPYRRLMRKTGRAYFKTGTLYGINTKAGYIENARGALYDFVILINTPGKSPEPIMDVLLRELN